MAPTATNEPLGPRRVAWAVVFLALGLALGLAFGVVGHRRQKAPAPIMTGTTAPPIVEIPPTPATMTVASIGDRAMVYMDHASGTISLLTLTDTGTLEVSRVYRLVHDPDRNVYEPDRRHLHGWYLDDVGEAVATEVEAARAEWRHVTTAEVQSAAPDESIDRAAGRLSALGEVPVLREALRHPRYVVRRAAAFALAARGDRAAVPALADLLAEPDMEGRTRIREALVRLSGQDFVEDPDLIDQGRAIARWKAWCAESKRPSSPPMSAAAEGDVR